MREKLLPWLPAIFCGMLSLITMGADIFGRFATGTANVGLSTFLCFLPMCFFHVGVMLTNLRDENRELTRRLEEFLLRNDENRKSAARQTV
jgi:hypothetical protein